MCGIAECRAPAGTAGSEGNLTISSNGQERLASTGVGYQLPCRALNEKQASVITHDPNPH